MRMHKPELLDYRKFEVYYHNDLKIGWDVVKLQRAADRGCFGYAQEIDVSEQIFSDDNEINVAKVWRFTERPDILALRLIAVELPSGLGLLVDGHHRALARRHRRLYRTFCYVVPARLETYFRFDPTGLFDPGSGLETEVWQP